MCLRSSNLLTAVMLIGLVLLGATQGVGSQESREEAKKLVNPVPADAASIEDGRKAYVRYCASCHGPRGKGDGSMALSGGTPSNLTDEDWDHGSTDGEIFIVIRDGVSNDMEGYKDRLSEKQMWNLINYLRSIGPKQ